MKNKYILLRDQLLQNPLAHSHLLIISPFETQWPIVNTG